ncbi:hypothetical protein T484DRAFT_1939757 [Baffinella frigidus]|nr:hypothetical protein T484DRAFT_1939757 [Cryptophyta sp. CCMP2293]
MPQDIARSVAADVLNRSSEYVKTRKPDVHGKIASTVIYATETRLGSAALRVGNTGLFLVDGIIDRGMSTSAFKRMEALLVEVILPNANSFVESAQTSAATTVVAVRALPADVKERTVRRVGEANTAVRRRVNAAKCSATDAKTRAHGAYSSARASASTRVTLARSSVSNRVSNVRSSVSNRVSIVRSSVNFRYSNARKSVSTRYFNARTSAHARMAALRAAADGTLAAVSTRASTARSSARAMVSRTVMAAVMKKDALLKAAVQQWGEGVGALWLLRVRLVASATSLRNAAYSRVCLYCGIVRQQADRIISTIRGTRTSPATPAPAPPADSSKAENITLLWSPARLSPAPAAATEDITPIYSAASDPASHLTFDAEATLTPIYEVAETPTDFSYEAAASPTMMLSSSSSPTEEAEVFSADALPGSPFKASLSWNIPSEKSAEIPTEKTEKLSKAQKKKKALATKRAERAAAMPVKRAAWDASPSPAKQVGFQGAPKSPLAARSTNTVPA